MQNRLHPAVRQSLIEIVKLRFAREIKFYTHPNMRNTPQDAGAKEPENWTADLLALHMLDALPTKGADRFDELERTLTALYNVLLLEIDPAEAYPYFHYAQERMIEGVKKDIADAITFENFQKIHALRNNIINGNEDDLTLLMYFIIYSDFGKSPMIREMLEPYKDMVDTKLPPDDLIASVLTHLTNAQIETVLPSFGLLSDSNKERLKLFYPLMKPCFGHILFYERGQKTFDLIAAELVSIPAVDSQLAIKMLFLAQFGDGLGAQGQGRIIGSANCTNNFYQRYQLMYDTLISMTRDLKSDTADVVSTAVSNAFQATLKQRAEWLGFADDWDNLSADEVRKRQVLVRVGCMIGCPHDGRSAEILTQYFDLHLTSAQQNVLLQQLSFDTQTGLEAWTRVDYIATAPLNLAQDDIRAAKLESAIDQGMRGSVCLAMLLEYIAATYPDIIKDSSRSISLADFAFQTQDKSQLQFFYPENFNPRNYEFNYTSNRVEKKKLTALASHSLLAAAPQQPPQAPAPEVLASSFVTASPRQ
jgi:hypothetical protein